MVCIQISSSSIRFDSLLGTGRQIDGIAETEFVMDRISWDQVGGSFAFLSLCIPRFFSSKENINSIVQKGIFQSHFSVVSIVTYMFCAGIFHLIDCSFSRDESVDLSYTYNVWRGKSFPSFLGKS